MKEINLKYLSRFLWKIHSRPIKMKGDDTAPKDTVTQEKINPILWRYVITMHQRFKIVEIQTQFDLQELFAYYSNFF